jgi:hypothetical protein
VGTIILKPWPGVRLAIFPLSVLDVALHCPQEFKVAVSVWIFLQPMPFLGSRVIVTVLVSLAMHFPVLEDNFFML